MLPQVLRTAAEVLDNVPGVAHPEITCGARHELRQTHRADRRKRRAIVTAFLSYQRVEQTDGNVLLARDRGDQREQGGPSLLRAGGEIASRPIDRLRAVARDVSKRTHRWDRHAPCRDAAPHPQRNVDSRRLDDVIGILKNWRTNRSEIGRERILQRLDSSRWHFGTRRRPHIEDYAGLGSVEVHELNLLSTDRTCDNR